MAQPTTQTGSGTGGRFTLDCREYPGSKCSMTISGTKDEVLNEGLYHAKQFHGEKEEGLRDRLSKVLKEEKKTYSA